MNKRIRGRRAKAAESARSMVPRISEVEALILGCLAKGGRMYGLELVAVSNGRLKRGTVYVTLGRMVDKGYLDSVAETLAMPLPGLPRRMYFITDAGKLAYRASRQIAALLEKLQLSLEER